MSEQVRVQILSHKTPQALDTQKAMQFGTGGLTGMLCVLAVLDAGLKPADGPIAVSGAGGGVGGIATTVLSTLGYEVHAITGKNPACPTQELGAVEILKRADFMRDPKPLESTRFAGAIDTVEPMLATLIPKSCTTALLLPLLMRADSIFDTVFPFILRNIRLQSVDSVHAPSKSGRAGNYFRKRDNRSINASTRTMVWIR